MFDTTTTQRSTDMMTKSATSKKEKITVTVDPDLLRMVDAFVDQTRKNGTSRSSVFEQALHLWKQAMRDDFDAAYYSQQAKTDADETSWTAISTEAAKHIWAQ
jgi:hypothetical protein